MSQQKEEFVEETLVHFCLIWFSFMEYYTSICLHKCLFYGSFVCKARNIKKQTNTRRTQILDYCSTMDKK